MSLKRGKVSDVGAEAPQLIFYTRAVKSSSEFYG